MAIKKLMGLWVGESKNGHKYMSGKNNRDIEIKAGQKVFIFKNDRKNKDTDPDYRLSVADDGEEQGLL
jgi:hypothetical protein